MSGVDILAVATIVALFFLWADRERRRAGMLEREVEREAEWRQDAEAERDAFESLWVERAEERIG